MIPITRIVAIAMAAVLCFAVLLPLALSRHNAALAIFIVAVFAAYAVANVMLWLRLNRRA